MKAVRLNEPFDLNRVDLDEPEAPAPGHALVRSHRIGICGTDYHAFAGEQPFFSYPRVLGHEMCVEVLAVGSGVDHVRPGDLCAVMPYVHCGECIACRRGRTNCCSDLKVMGVHVDGGMRQRLQVRADLLFASSKLTPDQLVLVEPLGIAAHAVERADPQPGENVLVLGAGPIGLGVAQFCRVRGNRVIALDLNEKRLEFCASAIGVDETVVGGEGAVERVADLTDGDLPTVVVDATGSQASMNQSFEYVAHSGRVCFVGIVRKDVTFHHPLFHMREMTLLGSRNAVAKQFRDIIGWIEEGRLDTSPWITHRSSLDTLCDDFESFTKPETGVIKAIIDIEE